MKKTLILVILSLIITTAFCQTNKYRPFPESNAIWDQTTWSAVDGCCEIWDDQSLYISGDTTIGPYTYHKLYLNGYTSESCFECGNPFPPYYHIGDYWGAYRQDTLNKRVYLYQGKDTLAYDFNLNVGDQIHSCLNYCGNSVHSIDSVLVGNKYTKRFWLSCDGQTDYVALIEGIGSTYGAFALLVFPFESGSTLYCVKENNQTVWPSDTTYGCALITMVDELNIKPRIFIYPNPATEIITVELSLTPTNSQLSIINLNGEEVLIRSLIKLKTQIDISNLPSGVYFVRLINDKTVEVGKFIKK